MSGIRPSGVFYAIMGLVSSTIAVLAFGSLVAVESRADTTSTTSTVSNASPSTGVIFVSDKRGSGDITASGFTPNEGRTKTLFVRGTVTDPNGCSDLKDVEVKVYRSGAGQNCSENPNDCYATSTEKFLNCKTSGKYASYEVGMDIQYFADPTDVGSPFDNQYWFADATVVDLKQARYTASTHFEMNSIAALGMVTSTLSYGTIPMGGTSKVQEAVLANAGNRNVQGSIRADADLVSDLKGFSSVSSTQVHVSTSREFKWEDGLPVRTDKDTDLQIFLPKQIFPDRLQTANVFFRLKMPPLGLSGNYSNELIFTGRAY